MTKVMVFNFETMQYEQASEAEGKEFLGLIESMNADCAAQHSVQRIGCTCGAKIQAPGNDYPHAAWCPANPANR